MTEAVVAAPTGAQGGNATPPTQGAAAPKMYEVTIDGQKHQVAENELVQNYQMRKASEDRMNEAALMRKQAEAFLRSAKTDTASALRELGIDPVEFANKLAQEQIENELLDPKDRELRDTKKKLSEFQKSKEAEEATRAEAEAKAAADSYAADIQPKIQKAIVEAKLPSTGTAGAKTWDRIVSYMIKFNEAGYDGIKLPMVQPKDVIDLVVKDYQEDVRALLGAGEDDAIANILGDEILGRVSKAQLKRIQAAQKQGKVVPGQQKQGVKSDPKSKKNKYGDPTDFFDKARRQHGG